MLHLFNLDQQLPLPASGSGLLQDGFFAS